MKAKLKYGCRIAGTLYQKGTHVEILDATDSVVQWRYFGIAPKDDSENVAVRFPGRDHPTLVKLSELETFSMDEMLELALEAKEVVSEMEQIFYRQCTLRKGSTNQVAWIPEQFAKQSKYLRIGSDNGWQVVESGSLRMSGQYLSDHEREYLNHRSVSDR